MSRVAAPLTIILGFVVMVRLWTWPFSFGGSRQRLLDYITCVLAICCAGLQATTHTFVKSDLCEASNLTATDENGNIIVWDTCDKLTTAYNITFGTIAGWVVVAIFVFCLPRNNNQQKEEEAMESPQDIDAADEV
jgi:Trk-type K+ transport system membrane component